MKYDPKPKKCNLCGGQAIFNRASKDKSVSGFVYYCTNCHAWVGTYPHQKEIAYGIYDKFHDVSSLNVHSEITSLLIQLIKLLRTGKMKKEQIPFDNIAKCIQGEILSTRKCSEELINSIIGSITDVLNFAKSEASNIDDVILYMQIIINFIELTK